MTLEVLYLFLSTFGLVFFLGFQSLAVNSGNFWLAGANSLVIGTLNLVLFKTAPHATGVWEIGAYIFGGPLGILCAMWTHRNVVSRFRKDTNGSG
jgi:hypothetical protein